MLIIYTVKYLNICKCINIFIPKHWRQNMKGNINSKKSVIVCIILLLISSLNLFTIVSSAPIKDDNDGIWFDDFGNSSGISENVNCVVSNSSVKLDYGSNIRYYDYAAAGNKHEAWSSDSSSATGEEAELLLLPRDLPLQVSFGNEAINAIKYNDDKVEETQSVYFDNSLSNHTYSPVHHFRFKIDQNKDSIKEINFSWWYGDYKSDANIEYLNLYAWDYSYLFKDRWVQVKTKLYGVGSNFIPFTSDDTSYISSDGYIDFLIIATPSINGETCILTTDYVNLTITTKFGYLEDGYITSVEIAPTSLGRWESVVWSGSRLTDISYVKIQVLNETGGVIKSLTGNSNGFTTSPIDLSSLATSIKKIKLKALLHSDDLSFAPQLYDWGTTWQTQTDRFNDSFTTSLRIDKIVGANIADKINMSDFYSNWPIFGKNPANTRYYEGYGPQTSSLYWATRKETVGGGARSPVMSDGIIYIASSVDDKIYAFTATGKTDEKDPIDSSNSPYVVDSSVAVTDNYLIVATGKINASNKIYALDKSNLKNEIWSYSYSGGNICFSSAPTVADEKVFVTSWTGNYRSTPLLSFLEKLLKGNNKLIALNLADGSKVWDKYYKDLPAGSFSTPAVADGKVFVGCDNMYGSNLFAFDEETGKEIWNKSVGLMGGASPVVFDGKVFVVVKKLSPLSVKGDVKIFALNENNGTMIWNITLAKNVPAFESLPKGLHFYNLMSTSTPAIKEDENKLFVTSPDGKVYAIRMDGTVNWSINLPSAVYGVIPTYSCTSTVVAGDEVYVAAANGIIYALGASDGKELWKFNCETEDPELLAPTYILSSPIVADGLIYVSVTEDLSTLSGRIYSIGNYTANQKARVISNPIHVPTGNWWKNFQAEYSNSTNSAVKFSILDEEYNTLLKLDGVKSNVPTSINSSKINSNAIRLCAEFSRKNKSQDPTLNSWGVTWTQENQPPEFDGNSFKPDPSGWINTKTPECSIKVHDVAYDSVLSGLDVDSAQYRLEYLPGGSIISKAKCADPNGVKATTLTAAIQDLNITISDLKSITFSIKDLAGNKATNVTKTFKMDMVKPTSKIDNIGDFSDKYNEPVSIKANASDDKSGVRTIALCYRFSSDDRNWGNWITFSDIGNPYEWLFDLSGEDYESGYYELCTIATDNAGNKEDLPTSDNDNRILSFIYDTVKPYISTEFTDEYRFNELPRFSIKFNDDFELKKVEYSLNFNTNWTLIKNNIDSKSYTGEWNIAQNDWDYMNEEDEYSLYFKLTDSCGNQYITNSSNEALNIIKDLTTSGSYLDLSDFQDWHWDNTFTIATNPSSETGITKMELYYRYSSDKEEWSEWKQYGDNLTGSPFKWKFTADEGSGCYEFYTKVWASGMVGESEVESINVALFPTTAVIVMIFLVIILTLISAFILIKMKKKKN